MINLIKLCVGADSIEDLTGWQATARAKGPDGLAAPRHPDVAQARRRSSERRVDLLGCSRVWCCAASASCGWTEVEGADGILRCGIVLDPTPVRVAPTQRRPFQGWRYLPPEDAPRDLRNSRREEDALPPAMQSALAEIGVL